MSDRAVEPVSLALSPEADSQTVADATTDQDGDNDDGGTFTREG